MGNFRRKSALFAITVGGALIVSACGSKSNGSDSTNMTAVNGVEGTTNDMTAIDSATGQAENLANDTAASNGAENAAGNSGNASGNAM